MTSDRALFEACQAGESYRDIAARLNMNADGVRGRLWRHQQSIAQPDYKLFQTPALGTPLHLTGDFMVTGDYQLPTFDVDFFELMLAVAKRQLKAPRQLIIAGDFLNNDAFSQYDADIAPASLEQELEAARYVMRRLTAVFAHIFWSWGNHERRSGKRNPQITPAILRSLVTQDERVTVSHWSHLTIDSPHGVWRVTHPRNYSINRLTVAGELALKYQSHIVAHHEHHLAQGWDRFGRYVVINNGGFFAQQQMGYAVLDDSKSPNMTNGFTLLKSGVGRVFGMTPFTAWDEVLPLSLLQKKDR